MNRTFALIASGVLLTATVTTSSDAQTFKDLFLVNGAGSLTLRAPSSGNATFTFPTPSGSSATILTSDANQTINGILSLGNYTTPTVGKLNLWADATHYVLLDASGNTGTGTFTFPNTGGVIATSGNTILNGTSQQTGVSFNVEGSGEVGTTFAAATSVTSPIVAGGTAPTSVLTLQGTTDASPTASYVQVQGAGRPSSFAIDGIFMGKETNNYGIEIVNDAGLPYIDFTSHASTDYDARLILQPSDELSLMGAHFSIDNGGTLLTLAETGISRTGADIAINPGTGSKITTNGILMVEEALGANGTPLSGGYYADNAVRAWANVAAAGLRVGEFGFSSMSHSSTGVYYIPMTTPLTSTTSGSVQVTLQSPGFATAVISSADVIMVSTYNTAGVAADLDFFVQVVGR